eukprot:CAMPEP_0184995032 /NCGR_PEP_ID=MMETSP1098-20130426/51533_1 /TAXON_ID=89044 /ORGANISM="Spumella elongata, Strain CCAP 955/1" /LENGTH=1309 /DNA_ID=CAMNT_0027521221 /DNA_START=397 /DNA_END=4326 /DNA_ORIENTATION=-
MGEPWESTLPAIENSISVHDDQISGIRQIDEYRTKRVSKSSAYGRPFKPSVSSQSDNSDTDSGEEGNMAQQRSRVKASTVKYNKTANSSTHNKEITRNPQQSFKETASMVTTTVASSAAFNNNLPPAGSTIAKTSVHPPSTPPRTSSCSTVPIAHAPSLRTKLVMIEDYAFSVSTMDVVVGQWIEFRLAEDVPAHAEHEICGISTVKQLCFESPLLQQEECTSYTYCPAHPGEIAVSCKIYPEMSCAIVVHPQTVRLDATPPVSPDRLSAAERRRDGTYNPRVAFQSAEKSADRHSRNPLSTDASLGGMMDVTSPPPAHLQSPTSPTSPAYQDVGEAVLQFDASKVPSPHRGYGSESQSSFYDSDDIFSDFEPAAKLQYQFEDAVEESDARNSRSLLEEVRLGLKNPGYADNIINTRAPAYSATASTSSIATTSNASTNGVRKNTPHVASHVIDQIVSIEEFSFRPHQIQVRCGEWVRFRRPAALVSASLVCEGEFVASEVNWPVEGDYLCLDHCFTKPGVFDVCNVIYTFCKCEVLVMLHNPPSLLGGNVRKGATPKLHGSFSAAPAKPVFHFPITDEEKQGLKNMPQRMAAPLTATTSTTVNVTTTSTVICSSSSPTNIAPLAHPTSATTSQVHTDSSDSDDTSLVQNPHDKQGKKKKGPTESTPLSKPVPLYGSFMNLSGGTGLQNATQSNNDNPNGLPRVAVDSNLENYINKFVSKLHPLDEVSEESEADNDGAEPDAAALKRRKKNQKKKEKLKLKQKQKRQAELEQQAIAETSEPMDVVEDETTEHHFFNHNADLVTDSTELAHSTLQVTTVFPSSIRTAVAADRSPEAVIDRYLKDAGVSRSRIQAQIDWGEEIELDDDLDEKTTSAYIGSASQGADGNMNAETNAAEEAVVMKKDSVSGTGKADDAPISASIEQQQETTSAVDESTTSAPVAAGKKKKNRSKAKRAGSFAQQEDALQETVSVDKTQPKRTEELGAVNGVTLAQSETVPVLALTATGNDSFPAPSLPLLATTPSSPPSTPRQNQDPRLSHAADVVNGVAENGVHAATVAAPNAVLSPESFVTPTKTRKPRKEKARTTVASSPTAANDSVNIAMEATTAIDANGSARTSASSPQINEKMSPTAFASPSAEPSTTPSTGDHMSRSSQLLRSALRIAPQHPQRDSPVPSVLFPEALEITVGQSSADVVAGAQLVGMEDAESINTGMVEDSAGEVVQDALLSACYAFEAQMEEFFLSRFDNVMDKLRRGQPDRLPSGKEVEIHYLEEQRETVIARGKHNPVKVTDSVHTAKNKDTAAPKKTKSKRK